MKPHACARDSQTSFAELLDVCRGLEFKPHDIGRQLDARGRYQLPLDKDFPFEVTLFHVGPGHYTPILNWHERLELTLSLDARMRMRMGDQAVELDPGDIVVVDNLKLHNVESYPGFDSRVIAISFLAEFVYTPGSSSCDYTFLLPFFAKREGHPHILRTGDEMAPAIFRSLAELLRRHAMAAQSFQARSGCKACLLEILYQLVKRFQSAEVLRAEFVQHRERRERLTRLFEYVRLNYAERISLEQACRLVQMSEAKFLKHFRRVTGMTLVAYVTRVRITQALRLLRETTMTIADIAAVTGFPDQSYFDRRFKEVIGRSPRQYRLELQGGSPGPNR